MGASATKEKQGVHERAMLEQGARKADLGQQIGARGNQYVNETSTKDYSSLYRGRLNADAAQALSKPVNSAYSTAAQGKGGLSGLSRVDKASTKARLAGVSEGTKRGVVGRDQNIFSAMNVSMGKQAGSSRNTSQLAKQEAAEIGTQARIASTEANNMRGAAMGLATAGLGAYQQNKMDGLREADIKDFELAKKHNTIDKDMSYADFSNNYRHNTNRRGAAYQNRNLSWSDRMANALGGAG